MLGILPAWAGVSRIVPLGLPVLGSFMNLSFRSFTRPRWFRMATFTYLMASWAAWLSPSLWPLWRTLKFSYIEVKTAFQLGNSGIYKNTLRLRLGGNKNVICATCYWSQQITETEGKGMNSTFSWEKYKNTWLLF